MFDDDATVGRVLSRREVMALLAATGAAGWSASRLAAQTPLPGCIVVPQQTQGPYFVDEKLLRSDIRSDPADGKIVPGLPLALTLKVSQLSSATACAPLAGAIVDLWQCDAVGEYSDVRDQKIGFDTRGKKFLRGHQITDSAGQVRFTTIYPGWYPGRCVHLHFKVRTDAKAAAGSEFTSQLYFDEAITDKVHSQAPYNAKGRRNTLNDNDGIFRNGGKQLMLQLTPDGTAYKGYFELAMKRA